MKLVTIESPYAGDVEANEAYLKECLIDSSIRGEAPFASHGFYTRYLDDNNPVERKLGMDSGFEWMKATDLVAVYVDRGISSGMIKGIEKAQSLDIPIVFRRVKEKKNLYFKPEWLDPEYLKKLRSMPPKEFERLYVGEYPVLEKDERPEHVKGGRIPTPPRAWWPKEFSNDKPKRMVEEGAEPKIIKIDIKS